MVGDGRSQTHPGRLAPEVTLCSMQSRSQENFLETVPNLHLKNELKIILFSYATRDMDTILILKGKSTQDNIVHGKYDIYVKNNICVGTRIPLLISCLVLRVPDILMGVPIETDSIKWER